MKTGPIKTGPMKTVPLRLAELTWPEAERLGASGGLLALPVGSTEQHGPHLPLSTDTLVAIALAEGLAAARPDVVVAPALTYAASGEHSEFPGTVSIGLEALEAVLVEWGRSAAATFAHLVFVNGHGGNVAAAAAARLEVEARPTLAWSPRWAGDAHAGLVETSLLLALHPSLVRLDQAVAGNETPLTDLMADLRAGRLRSISPSGVLGDPGGASAEYGRGLVEALTADLRAAVDAWRPRSTPPKR
jgi:mycofactocin precursor peptide peptidase